VTPERVTIGQLRKNNSLGIPLMFDSIVSIRGVVSSGKTNFDPTPGNLNFAIYDSTGAITIQFTGRNFGYSPFPGDSISLTGKTGFKNGLTLFELSGSAFDTLYRISTGNPVIAPILVKSISENEESALASTGYVRIVDTTEWKKGGFVRFYDRDADTFVIYRHPAVDFSSFELYPFSWYQISGVVSQLDSTAPFFSNYFLIPRSDADFQFVESVENFPAIKFSIYPNTIHDGQINITCDSHIISLTVSDIQGRERYRIQNPASSAMDINALAPGEYFIRIITANGTAAGRFIKY
jgi:hypothetical protein